MRLPLVLPPFLGRLISAAVLAAVLLLPLGCDPTVDVLGPSDQYRYSLFGTLDVAADTQIVRVEPLDDRVRVGAPQDIDVSVILENLDTGEQVSMRDSFAVVGDSIRVHNFWTAHPIEPATSYRIAVQEGDSSVTTVTTETPAQSPELSHNSSFYMPCDFDIPGTQTFSVTVRNVDQVATANVIYPITRVDVQDTIQTLNEFEYYENVEEIEEDVFQVNVPYQQTLVELNPNSQRGRGQECISEERFTEPHALAVIAVGGPDWPSWRGVPIDSLASPQSFTNVEGGHGFVGGVYSDTIEVPIQERPPDFTSDR